MVLLPLVRPLHGIIQNLHRLVPPPRHDEQDPSMGNLPRHDVDHAVRHHLLLRYSIPMQPHVILLERGTVWKVCQCQRRHRSSNTLQRLCRHFGFHLCSSSRTYCLEAATPQKDKVNVNPSSCHGLRVSLVPPTHLVKMLIERAGQARLLLLVSHTYPSLGRMISSVSTPCVLSLDHELT